MSPKDWRFNFERLRQRIIDAKLRGFAVRADTAATVERVRRERAKRRGLEYTPEPVENFVPAGRSKHVH